MTPEKIFENKVKSYLKQKNIWYVKYWGGSKYTKIGVPDLLCCINGMFVAIELKSAIGRPSEIQKYQIEEIRNSCGIAIVLYPKHFEKFKQLVEAILRCKCHIQEWNHIFNALINTN